MLCALALAVVLAPAAEKVAIYVGPSVRDGFVDVDSGVLDSIEDLRKELQGGDYETTFVGESESRWKARAQSIVKDLEVWLKANRDRLPAGK
jgi:hypothetical protein